MSPVKIITGDFEILETLDSDLHLSNLDAYVEVYNAIVKSIHEDTPLCVCVSENVSKRWLQVLAERYSNDVLIEDVDLRKTLGNKWGIEIPDWVDTENIKESNLGEISIAPLPGQTFEDFILYVYFSLFLTHSSIAIHQVGELVREFNEEEWLKSLALPIPLKIFEKRIEKWWGKAADKGEKLLIQWIKESPLKLFRKLSLLRLAENYPDEIGNRLLGEDYKYLRDLKINLADVTIDASDVSEAIDFIRVYLDQIFHQEDTDALEKLLSQVSGCLDIEFSYCLELLKTGLYHIDGDVIRRVRSVFSPLAHEPSIEYSIADLDLLVTREYPTVPDPNWNEDKWVNWAINEYLPYRFWLEETNTLSRDIEENVDLFSEWMFKNYNELRLNSERMAYQKIVKFLKGNKSDKALLVVIIDNFNAKFANSFISYMQTEGFFCETMGTDGFCFSLLPTCTEISKRGLLLGEPVPFAESGYKKIIEETWSKELGKKVLYLPHIGALREVSKKEHDVYILNYLPLDISLHQNEDHIGISHAQSIKNYLKALSRDIRSFSERISSEHDLSVFVISDHGSTKISEMASNPIDQKYFAKKALENHHRYIQISDKELIELPDNIKFQCYLFDKKKYGIHENYLVAKKYYRFKQTNENIYFHGGLSPEEVFVPAIKFSPVVVKPKPIKIWISNREFYIRRRSDLNLNIVNTNSYNCTNVIIVILNEKIDYQSLDVIEEIGAYDQKNFSFPIRFKHSRSGREILTINLTYDFLGKSYKQTEDIEIELKSIVETRPSIFDLDGVG